MAATNDLATRAEDEDPDMRPRSSAGTSRASQKARESRWPRFCGDSRAVAAITADQERSVHMMLHYE
jgi:hypothetical protein